VLQFLLFLLWCVIFFAPGAYFLVSKKSGLTGRIAGGLWIFAGFVSAFILDYVLGKWVDLMWYKEVGYVSRFWAPILTSWKVFLVVFFVSLAFMVINVLFAIIRTEGEDDAKIASGIKGSVEADYAIGMRWLLLAVSFILSLIIASIAATNWNQVLLYFNQVPFGITDPIFGKDLGFYVFTLPMIRFALDLGYAILFLTVVIAAIMYMFQVHDQGLGRYVNDWASAKGSKFLNHIISHGAILGVIWGIHLVFSTIKANWELLYSERGVVFGASYTDVHAQITANWIFCGSLIVAIVLFLIAAKVKSTDKTIGFAIAGAAVPLIAMILALWIYPWIVQTYEVSPNEIAKETPYIKHDIQFTREAWGLSADKVEEKTIPLDTGIGTDILKKDKASLDSVRLWSWQILGQTLRQTQLFRTYYDFGDIDIDRYTIDGKETQVMLTLREMDQKSLPEQSKTWLNEHFVYTHGSGAVVCQVNKFAPDGSPYFLAKDIPTKTTFDVFKIKSPEIYFGEKTGKYVYVGSYPEFDYPDGDENKTTRYDGTGGIRIGSGMRRFAIALRFDGLRLFTSEFVKPQTKIMFNRSIMSRVKAIAPTFLKLDPDPYAVIAEGRLFYILDAYTYSNDYPYSSPREFMEENVNYVRNSVKIVIDAKNGSVDFYVFDNDPFIQAYSRIYPGMFKSADKMPAELKKHIRYPEALFSVQAKIFGTYHMSNPGTFYNKEDAWRVASEKAKDQPIEPYYVLTNLESSKPEFAIVSPFSPLIRDNMIGWLAAKCDDPNYGKLVVYKFSKDRLTKGPLQIFANINQDETLSKDITLWNQQGSKVIWGNLIVTPLSGNRLMYSMPLFIQADQARMPELRRVILATNDKLVYANTYEEALKKLVTSEGGAIAQPNRAGGTKQTTDQLIREAADHLNNYQLLTGKGQIGNAGKELEEAGRILNQLVQPKN